MFEKKLVSIVSPAYNEEENIPLIVAEVEGVMSGLSDKYDFEYLLVDDGSSDRTWSMIQKEAQRNFRLRGIRLTRNFGQQIALSAGLDHIRGEAVILCDADLQHPPSLFPQMIAKWQEGAQIVHTQREETESETIFKKLMSQIFYKLAGFLSDLPIEKGMADFKLLDKEVYQKLRMMPERNRFLRGMVLWLGYPASLIHYQASKRTFGKPVYNFRKSLSLAKTGLLSLSIKPLKYIGYLGLGLVFLSALGLLVSFVIMLLKSDFRYISPTLLLVMFNTLLIGIVLSCLGIVALYISFLYQEVIQRPLYLIAEKVNVEK